MSVLIIGADHLGHIEKNLQSLGVSAIEHVKGRNVADRKDLRIPLSTELIVVFIDYVNHMTAQKIKKNAKAQGVPLVFANRSWSSLQDKLEAFDLRKLG